MKTKSNNTQNSGLKNRPEQLGTVGQTATASAPRPETREALPSLDFAKRQANRQLPTEQLIALLRCEAPRFFELAEVVGKWVWIQFADKQPREITRQLAEFGFHWNNKRQVWQHPCGPVTVDASPTDPRAKYGSIHPADVQPARPEPRHETHPPPFAPPAT